MTILSSFSFSLKETIKIIKLNKQLKFEKKLRYFLNINLDKLRLLS